MRRSSGRSRGSFDVKWADAGTKGEEVWSEVWFAMLCQLQGRVRQDPQQIIAAGAAEGERKHENKEQHEPENYKYSH
jgi:hypothetical protein